MITHTIYFQDLTQEVQAILWHAVAAELIRQGEVEYSTDEETAQEFDQRLHEQVDDYINRHNAIKIEI